MQCDIGLIEGGCCNADNVEVLREFRRKCDVLVAFGECAIWGGVPSMRNTIPLSECLEEAYLNSTTSMPDECVVPYHEDLPKILDKVYACNEIVRHRPLHSRLPAGRQPYLEIGAEPGFRQTALRSLF